MHQWAVIVTVVIGNLASFALAADIQGQGSGFSMYKERRLAEVLPYEASRRVETHQVMQRLGQLSLNPLFNETIEEIKTSTFPEWPRLVLIDNDNDRAADFFVYHSDDGPSDFYGAFFSLVDGGPPAWVVFPVCPALDDDKEFLFLFTHWVDQNSDGKLDLIILEGVDTDGSGWPEADTTAWVIDDDFDRLIDTAMHCVQSKCVEIIAQNGVFDLKLFLNKGESDNRVGAEFPAAVMLDGMFQDLRRATGKE